MLQTSKKHCTFGVDLGGTKIETVLVDASGYILSKEKHPTNPEKDAEGVIADPKYVLNSLKFCYG